MNFTREPVIETIITPKDGYKLTIRNSKGGSQEEYSVDALEVVSFGHSMFFRSEERPRAFLLPVAEYEVVETKETRVVLKNAPLEGAIKIGGGKVIKPPKEGEEKTPPAPKVDEPQEDRPKRRKSLSRRRRLAESEGRDGQQPRLSPELKPPAITPVTEQEKKPVNAEKKEEEAPVSSMMFRSLIPPPVGLISEKFQHDKLLQNTRAANAALMAEGKSKKGASSEKTEEPVAPKDVAEDEKDDDHDDHVAVADLDKEDDAPVADVGKEDTEESHEDHQTPRYHSAPIDDFDGPSFRLENNFLY
ncbi:MAG: hypothetical protein WCG10_03160 [Chlamydiota bacterium]